MGFNSAFKGLNKKDEIFEYTMYGVEEMSVKFSSKLSDKYIW
jgi:hypothetical protein